MPISGQRYRHDRRADSQCRLGCPDNMEVAGGRPFQNLLTYFRPPGVKCIRNIQKELNAFLLLGHNLTKAINKQNDFENKQAV